MARDKLGDLVVRAIAVGELPWTCRKVTVFLVCGAAGCDFFRLPRRNDKINQSKVWIRRISGPSSAEMPEIGPGSSLSSWDQTLFSARSEKQWHDGGLNRGSEQRDRAWNDDGKP